MKLTYRGLQYDHDAPTIDMMESEAGGLYRGCQWQVRYPRHIPVAKPSHELKYRGLAYCNSAINKNLVLDSASAAMPAEVTTIKKTDALSNSKQQKAMWHEVARIHQANICRSLERRMNAAQAKGDRKLMHLLQQESQDLACALF